MIYVYYILPIFTLVMGYLAGRFQTVLLAKISDLENAIKDIDTRKQPEKPTVVMGAYAPPPVVSNIVDKKRTGGLVEPKTPEQLDWEAKAALERRIQGGE